MEKKSDEHGDFGTTQTCIYVLSEISLSVVIIIKTNYFYNRLLYCYSINVYFMVFNLL